MARKHKDFLNEKYIDDSGKWRYTHTRLRSANFTLKRNLPFLFTCESVENLPKTNNGLEAEFMNLKTRLRVHSGLKLENKMSLFLIILGLKMMKDKVKNEHFWHPFLTIKPEFQKWNSKNFSAYEILEFQIILKSQIPRIYDFAGDCAGCDHG